MVIILDARKMEVLQDTVRHYMLLEQEGYDAMLTRLLCLNMQFVLEVRFSKIKIDPSKPGKKYRLILTAPEAATLCVFLHHCFDTATPYQKTIIGMVAAQVDMLRPVQPLLNLPGDLV